ncbi:MAG: hypothetical protein WDO70_04570 [Alphaproteobacteria bacterium]
MISGPFRIDAMGWKDVLVPRNLASLTLGCATVLLLTLSACGDVHVPEAKSLIGRRPALPEVPQPDETVRGEDDPAVVTLKIGRTLHERYLGRADDLPSDVIIPPTTLQNVPVTAALEAVLAGTDFSLSYTEGDYSDRLATLVNLRGPLPKVVQRICSAAKIFCIARDGNLELKEEQNFIIELPPIERHGTGGGVAATNTIADAISALAGKPVKQDEAGGNLIYTTTVEGQERVSKYLEQLRHGRPLIVLQMYIWEVSLDSEAAAGINWKNLNVSKLGGDWQSLAINSGASTFAAATGGVSVGAVLSGKVGAEIIANFLATQGEVQTISDPQLTFVSGSSAEFRVGGTRSYVSQVGQLTSNNVSGSSSSANGIGTNTVSTDKIETGLKINVNGSYESGVVFSTLEVNITDLIRIDSVQTGETTLQLPETSNRNFTTVLRVRPGDSMVLAGMTSSRDDSVRDRLNIPLINRIPLNRDDQKQNRELVVMLKPSLIFFADAKTVEDRQREEAPSMPVKAGVENNAIAPQQSIPVSQTDKPQLPSAVGVADGLAIDKEWMQQGFASALAELSGEPPQTGRGQP